MARFSRGMMLALPGTLDGMGTAAPHGRRPPRMTRVCWGRMEVEGLGRGRDFKLDAGGGRARDWAETGTLSDGGMHGGRIAGRAPPPHPAEPRSQPARSGRAELIRINVLYNAI